MPKEKKFRYNCRGFGGLQAITQGMTGNNCDKKEQLQPPKGRSFSGQESARAKRVPILYGLILSIIPFLLSGCMLIVQTGRRSDIERIETLENELEALRHTRGVLEEQLAQEIKDKQVRLAMEEKGLVITFVAEVLFDSGKAVLKPESLPILDKVVRILREEVPENNIGIEGHTDNEPIKYSGWKSNWELSAQRSLTVLHYLENKGMNPKRLSQAGYGEHRPVASNETAEGRQLNRRVEIVILPKTVKKLKQKLQEPSKEEELK